MTTDENEKTADQTASEPPVPNGHGTNGVHGTDPAVGDRAEDREDKAPSVKKRKKNRPQAKAAKAAQAPAPETTTEPTPETTTETAAVEPTEQPDAAKVAAVVEHDPATAVAASETEPSHAETPPSDPIASTQTPAVEPVEPAREGLRLRVKVWTDPKTSKRYLMPTAFMQDVVNGRPVSDVMRAYALSEEDTKIVTLRAHEWNSLPFYYFQEDGPAPRASGRPIDVVTLGGSST